MRYSKQMLHIIYLNKAQIIATLIRRFKEQIIVKPNIK